MQGGIKVIVPPIFPGVSFSISNLHFDNPKSVNLNIAFNKFKLFLSSSFL
jgi:hypothetical protein